MPPHIIDVEIDERLQSQHTDRNTYLKITVKGQDGKERDGRHECVKRGELVRWRTSSPKLHVEFRKNGSPFESDPDPEPVCDQGPVCTKLVRVRKYGKLNSCYDYKVTVKKPDDTPFPEDPQIMIDDGRLGLNLKWFLLAALGIGITVWGLSKLWASNRDD